MNIRISSIYNSFSRLKTIESTVVDLEVIKVEKILLRVLARLRHSSLGPYTY